MANLDIKRVLFVIGIVMIIWFGLFNLVKKSCVPGTRSMELAGGSPAI